MTHNYQTKNNKLVIQRCSNEQTLDNGIKVTEARGKKDIVKGIPVVTYETSLPIGHNNEFVLEKESSKNIFIWYPLYAALPISIEGNTYDVIDQQDIIMEEEVYED